MQTFKAETFAVILLGVLFILVSSCGPKQADKIGDAQSCLDSASSAEVDACLEKIEGIETAGAYSLRCAGYFMREGILDPNRLIDAFSSLSSTTMTSGEKYGAFMSMVTFTRSAPDWGLNYARAKGTYDACLSAEGRATTFIATFSIFSSALLAYGSATGVSLDYSSSSAVATTIQTVLTALGIDVLDVPVVGISTDGQTALSRMGSAILQTYTVACNIGKPIDVNTCTQFGNAITNAGASASPQEIGLKFLLSLAT